MDPWHGAQRRGAGSFQQLRRDGDDTTQGGALCTGLRITAFHLAQAYAALPGFRVPMQPAAASDGLCRVYAIPSERRVVWLPTPSAVAIAHT